MRGWKLFIVGWLLSSFLWGGEILPEKVIRNVEEKLASAKTVRVIFEETYIWKLTGEEHALEGELLLEGENRFRIMTEDQIIVSDGETLWTYSKPSHRVIIDKLASSENTLLPRQILFRYRKDYEVRIVGEEGVFEDFCYVLELTAETGDVFIPKVKVWIDKREWIPRKVEQTDLNGNRTVYLLNEVQLGVLLDEKTFQFNIPENAEVIDLK